MKNVTLSADDSLIEAARNKAREENTTLNEQFRCWLEAYVGRELQAERAMRTVRELQQRIQLEGLPFSRDELNER
jgi:hypothetical protein